MTPKYPTPPGYCSRAFNALRGRYNQTQFSRVWGCFRKDDITRQTGHGCDGRKLRELVAWDRNLVCREDWKISSTVDGKKKTSNFRVYWLNPDYPQKAVGRDIDLVKLPAVAPHDVRLVARRVEGYAPIRPGSNGRLFEFLVPGVGA